MVRGLPRLPRLQRVVLRPMRGSHAGPHARLRAMPANRTLVGRYLGALRVCVAVGHAGRTLQVPWQPRRRTRVIDLLDGSRPATDPAGTHPAGAPAHESPARPWL